MNMVVMVETDIANVAVLLMTIPATQLHEQGPLPAPPAGVVITYGIPN